MKSQFFTSCSYACGSVHIRVATGIQKTLVMVLLHGNYMITYGQPRDKFSGTYEAKNARIGAW